MKTRFISLASGSSGNCYYLGTERYGILVDAGISVRAIRKTLRDVGITMESIRAVLITHDHTDHIKGVGGLGGRWGIPIYATRRVHEGIGRSYCVSSKLPPTVARSLEKHELLRIEDLEIEAFDVPHDGTDNVGYRIRVGQDKVFTFLTDLGEITTEAASFALQANYLIIEANYDEEMLRTGRYPQYLKERIASRTGHLCNATTARFLAENFPSHLSHIWLCHLSRDNNHPELARKTVEQALRERGIAVGRDVQLYALARTTPSPLYEFE